VCNEVIEAQCWLRVLAILLQMNEKKISCKDKNPFIFEEEHMSLPV
jgi:hypothetical protein